MINDLKFWLCVISVLIIYLPYSILRFTSGVLFKMIVYLTAKITELRLKGEAQFHGQANQERQEENR
jgi:hypothetical protein